MTTILLPRPDRSLELYRVGPPSPYPDTADGGFTRTVYAAAHVVADPFASEMPWMRAAIDWDATLAFRSHLWRLGFKVAEAMDTSQRGMGFDWATAPDLIGRSLAAARAEAATSPAAPARIISTRSRRKAWRTWSAPTRSRSASSRPRAVASF